MAERSNFLTAVNGVVALTLLAAGGPVGLAATSAFAAEFPAHAGPVGPYEPILASVGTKRFIAFYVPDNGRCAVNAVVWDDATPDAPARLRISLNPGQVFHLDSPKLETVMFQCNDNASSLSADGPALISMGDALSE
jgi:hypothetical protein